MVSILGVFQHWGAFTVGISGQLATVTGFVPLSLSFDILRMLSGHKDPLIWFSITSHVFNLISPSSPLIGSFCLSFSSLCAARLLGVKFGVDFQGTYDNVILFEFLIVVAPHASPTLYRYTFVPPPLYMTVTLPTQKYTF